MKLQSIGVLIPVFVFLIGCNSRPKKSSETDLVDEYTVHGTIEGLEDGMVYLKKNEVLTRTIEVLDSTEIVNGEFTFTGKTESPDQVFLQKGDNVIQFFLENAPIEIWADATKERKDFAGLEAKIEGSALNNLFSQQRAKEEEIMNQAKYAELKQLQEDFHNAQRKGETEKSKKLYAALEELQELSNERTKEVLEAKLSFVKKHPNSAVAPSVLGFMFSERDLEVAEMDEIMERFSGDALNTSMYEYFENEYQSIKRTSPGALAPDFTLKTPEGNDFSLAETKGKHVLLDFWASWCKPCRASYPHLKEVYKKYKGEGFEVVAISTDSDHDAWKKAIEEDQTNWVHVVDTFSRPGFPSDIGTLYAVPFLPTTYLLDDTGKILAKNLHADELDAELIRIFGK